MRREVHHLPEPPHPPPDPHLISAPKDPAAPLSASIETVAVCGKPHCEKMEMMRQDSIFNVLVQPIREQFLAERKARIERARANARNLPKE